MSDLAALEKHAHFTRSEADLADATASGAAEHVANLRAALSVAEDTHAAAKSAAVTAHAAADAAAAEVAAASDPGEVRAAAGTAAGTATGAAAKP